MMAVKTVTAATVYVAEQSIPSICYLVDTTDNDITVKLKKAGECIGQTIFFKNLVAANSMCVSAATGETIDGSGSLSSTTQYDRIEIVSGGTSTWHITRNGTFA
jgi:hypothetical protein